MRYLTVLLVSVFVAVAVATTIFVVNPPAAEAAGGVRKCGGGTISLNADEKETFVQHNRERRDRNLSPLCVHPDLQRAARSHSEDMIRRDYFSHDTKGRNETACERIKRYGYRYRLCGENIANGSGAYGEPESVMRRWMQSDGHRSNILNGRFREVGIGTYTGTFNGTSNVTMYTADYGTRR